MSTPIGELLRKMPGLQTGPHIRFISASLVELAKTDLRSARQIATAIIDNSRVQNTSLYQAALELSQIKTDPATDILFKNKSDRYAQLPVRNTGPIPDDIDLLNRSTALAAFIGMANEVNTDDMDVNEVTDLVLAMPHEKRAAFAEAAIMGNQPGVKAHLLPVGIDLE